MSSPPLRQAIAGTLATLADGMALCAPGPNSFRRFRSEAYVPVHADWSINNRGSAMRVPASDAANLRLEHRLAGADANPYLVVAWVLAGIHHGLAARLEPPPPPPATSTTSPASRCLSTGTKPSGDLHTAGSAARTSAKNS